VPELPELAAHAERLTAGYAGAVLDGFEPLSFTALKTYTPAPETAVGSGLRAVSRRGKHLVADFGTASFVIHLMQGGRLRADHKRARRPRNGVARWHFRDAPAWLLTEAGAEHRAGVWVVSGDLLAQPPLAGLGDEADAVDTARLVELLASHSMRLHTFLRDQSVVAGVGRRLANEVCHRARLSPFSQTARLGEQGAAQISEALAACLADELAAERARDDISSAAERATAVHGRTGQPCPACDDEIREVAYRDYTVNYCASCQTGGKVLADNTTSKFVK
jgi:formamidopyrimidine-DNA glycosylase